MTALSKNGRPRRAPWIVHKETTHQCYEVASRNSQTIVILQDISAVIWQMCDGNRSCEEILSLFSAAYPQNPEVEKDVTDLILSLLDQDLLVIDGGAGALEYQGDVIRTLTASDRLLQQLEFIREYIFKELRIQELGSIDSDLSACLGVDALLSAKRQDANAAAINDCTVIPVAGGLGQDALKESVEICNSEISALLPEVETIVERTGEAVYLRGSHMGWHSNHGRSDGRIYCSWSEQAGTNFFRYEDPLTGEIVTRREQQGWNVKSFTIPPNDARFWHCIGAESLRLSIGFRYNLPVMNICKGQ